MSTSLVIVLAAVKIAAWAIPTVLVALGIARRLHPIDWE